MTADSEMEVEVGMDPDMMAAAAMLSFGAGSCVGQKGPGPVLEYDVEARGRPARGSSSPPSSGLYQPLTLLH